MSLMKSQVGIPWYGAGLRFECQRCGACCGGEPGEVLVTPEEIEAIARHLGESVEEFSARCLRYTRRGASIIERENGDCILLSDGSDGRRRGCTAYEVRPEQCRTWPFWKENLASPRAWRRAAAECPGMGSGRLYEIREIEALGF